MVEPLNDGNVGAVARSMKNFGLDELVLVRPCMLSEEATKRAMHGIDILKGAKIVYSDEEAIKDVDFVAATSGVDTANEKNFARISHTPREFAEKIRESDKRIAILFGREDFGLPKETIKKSDFLITIPANPNYSILNMSHAAAIVFYELFATGVERWSPREAGELEKEKLFEYFSVLLDAIDYPPHKKEKTKVMFRRMINRSVPSTWEFHTLMGVFDGAIKISAPEAHPRKKRQTKS
ncbi:MAG: RNA methyltransferase [Candidatus Thermoplasmatota archaeon]|nr:RNA methyltransferase [Candidatus Thermoplasmatota archaeon]